MKYKILTSEEQTTQTGKNYKRATLRDEFDKEHDVSVWPDYPSYAGVEVGIMVEGVITTKGKYKNLVDANRQQTPYSTKTGQIAQAQQRKETSIEQAQHRTAEMWAKTQACELVAHHPAYQDLNPQDIEGTIEDLARHILAMDIRPKPF